MVFCLHRILLKWVQAFQVAELPTFTAAVIVVKGQNNEPQLSAVMQTKAKHSIERLLGTTKQLCESPTKEQYLSRVE